MLQNYVTILLCKSFFNFFQNFFLVRNHNKKKQKIIWIQKLLDFFACNIPFALVGHVKLKNIIQRLRPGHPLTNVMDECKEVLENERIPMDLDA